MAEEVDGGEVNLAVSAEAVLLQVPLAAVEPDHLAGDVLAVEHHEGRGGRGGGGGHLLLERAGGVGDGHDQVGGAGQLDAVQTQGVDLEAVVTVRERGGVQAHGGTQVVADEQRLVVEGNGSHRVGGRLGFDHDMRGDDHTLVGRQHAGGRLDDDGQGARGDGDLQGPRGGDQPDRQDENRNYEQSFRHGHPSVRKDVSGWR